MTLHIYGIVRATHPRHPHTPRLVVWQDLAAAVRERPDDGGEPDPVAHFGVLSTLVADGPVVPVRFGTLARDVNAVCGEVLGRAAPRLRAQLDRLTGLCEIHIGLRFAENAGLRAVAAADPNWLRLTGPLELSERIRLGEQVANRLVDWRRARAEELLAPIVAQAQQSRPLPDRAHTEDRRAFLLPLDRLRTVRALVDEITTAGEAHAECVGPLPAFHFLTDTDSPRTPGGSPARASRWGW